MISDRRFKIALDSWITQEQDISFDPICDSCGEVCGQPCTNLIEKWDKLGEEERQQDEEYEAWLKEQNLPDVCENCGKNVDPIQNHMWGCPYCGHNEPPGFQSPIH